MHHDSGRYQRRLLKVDPVTEALEDEYGDLGVVLACLLVHGLYEEIVNVGDHKDAEDVLQEPNDSCHHLGEHSGARS